MCITCIKYQPIQGEANILTRSVDFPTANRVQETLKCRHCHELLIHVYYHEPKDKCFKNNRMIDIKRNLDERTSISNAR